MTLILNLNGNFPQYLPIDHKITDILTSNNTLLHGQMSGINKQNRVNSGLCLLLVMMYANTHYCNYCCRCCVDVE